MENPQVEISCGNEAFKSINFSACFKVNSNRKLEKGRKLNKFNPITNLTGIKFTVKETHQQDRVEAKNGSSYDD